MRIAVAAALAAAAAGCSANLSLNDVTLVPKPDAMRKPDWATFSGGKNDFLRPITRADLVGPEGQCAGSPSEQAAPAGDPAAPPGAPAAAPLLAGGISLQMTECDVVRRAGIAENVDFGVNDRGERAVVLTYLKGPWPGVYRFAGGRLVSIERAPAPPPPPPAPAKPEKPRKAAKKPTGT